MNTELIALYNIARKTGLTATRALQQASAWLRFGLTADNISLIND